MSGSNSSQSNDKKISSTRAGEKSYCNGHNSNFQRTEHLDDIKGSIITIRENIQMMKEIMPHMERTRKLMENQLKPPNNEQRHHSYKH